MKVFDRSEPVGQGTHELHELQRFSLRFSHADGLEAENLPRLKLRDPTEVCRDHGCQLGVAPGGAAIGHQHDRRAIAGHLNAAVHSAIRDDVVPVKMVDHRAFKPVAHAVARRRYLPFALQKQLYRVLAELVVLRAQHDADWQLAGYRNFDPPFRNSSCGRDRVQLVASLQWTRVWAAQAGARIHRKAAEYRLARYSTVDGEVAERTATRETQVQCLALTERHGAIPWDGAARYVGLACCSCQADAHRTVTRGKRRTKRPDFDRGGKRCVSDQGVGRGKRKPVHRTARRQAVALGTMTPAVLNRTHGPNGGNDQLTHEAINSATSSPAWAARCCSA